MNSGLGLGSVRLGPEAGTKRMNVNAPGSGSGSWSWIWNPYHRDVVVVVVGDGSCE